MASYGTGQADPLSSFRRGRLDIIVASHEYASMRIEELKDLDFSYVFIDEAHTPIQVFLYERHTSDEQVQVPSADCDEWNGHTEPLRGPLLTGQIQEDLAACRLGLERHDSYAFKDRSTERRLCRATVRTPWKFQGLPGCGAS